MLLNGRERNLDAFRRLSCYITQDDRLQPLLTVCENMHIAADLKLGERVSKKKKTDIVSIINLLFYVHGRKNCKGTIQIAGVGKQAAQENICACLRNRKEEEGGEKLRGESKCVLLISLKIYDMGEICRTL